MAPPKKTDAEIPENPFERRAWIIYRLKGRGSSLAQIARSLNVTRQSVNSALFKSSARIEGAIAEALGLPVEVVFPERFFSLEHLGTPRPFSRTIRKKTCNDQTSMSVSS